MSAVARSLGICPDFMISSTISVMIVVAFSLCVVMASDTIPSDPGAFLCRGFSRASLNMPLYSGGRAAAGFAGVVRCWGSSPDLLAMMFLNSSVLARTGLFSLQLMRRESACEAWLGRAFAISVKVACWI